MSTNILQYESKVWATADLLIGAGIKQSDFPKFMMPFFALIMVESRLLRLADEKRAEFDEDEKEDMLEEIKDDNKGYNDVLLRQGKTLADICKNDKAFDIDYPSYLRSFDPETQLLLGVDRGNTEEKFMDISGISGQLKKKRILFATVKAWSEIDLRPFSNSEITTLEEHIKRRWADISAETAGEQYTPDDVIKKLDYKEQDLEVVAKSGTYRYDPEKETLIREHQGKTEALGCGKIAVKASYKKANKSRGTRVEITVELMPDYQKDYEIIPYSKDPEQNRRNIEAFMAQYITKPFQYLDNVVGVEINFNKVFYEPEQLRPIGEIMAELDDLDAALAKLEKELEL